MQILLTKSCSQSAAAGNTRHVAAKHILSSKHRNCFVRFLYILSVLSSVKARSLLFTTLYYNFAGFCKNLSEHFRARMKNSIFCTIVLPYYAVLCAFSIFIITFRLFLGRVGIYYKNQLGTFFRPFRTALKRRRAFRPADHQKKLTPTSLSEFPHKRGGTRCHKAPSFEIPKYLEMY